MYDNLLVRSFIEKDAFCVTAQVGINREWFSNLQLLRLLFNQFFQPVCSTKTEPTARSLSQTLKERVHQPAPKIPSKAWQQYQTPVSPVDWAWSWTMFHAKEATGCSPLALKSRASISGQSFLIWLERRCSSLLAMWRSSKTNTKRLYYAKQTNWDLLIPKNHYHHIKAKIAYTKTAAFLHLTLCAFDFLFSYWHTWLIYIIFCIHWKFCFLPR